MAIISTFLEILEKPTICDVVFELMGFLAPIWVAVVIGVLVGWSWKPKWANNIKVDFESTANKPNLVLFQIPSLKSLKLLQVPTCISSISHFGFEKEDSSLTSDSAPDYSSSNSENEKSSIVNGEDLKHLYNLVEEKDGGPVWIPMMDRSTSNMSYQAWRRDPEIGPPQYRSRTIYEDATPEMLRDFFWDDEFRAEWDDMLIHAETLDKDESNGTMLVQWVRKFPFFCSDREYIIGRRIWESGKTYYCVTKGVKNTVPRSSKPRRVDLYYSSWFIRAAESKRDGRMTACEVVLFHHEDMGIPREIAKLGIRQGMWGAVKKIDPALRLYQKHRASEAPLSPSALMAQINTKFSVDSMELLEGTTCTQEDECLNVSADKPTGRSFQKFLVVGGAVALACSLDRGLLTKAVIFGVARKFAKTGRRL